jgi:hypothetical protein
VEARYIWFVFQILGVVGMARVELDPQGRADLLELIEDRAARKATVITTQLPVEHWHAWIGDATIADALCDRLLQRAHRFHLGGESMRKPAAQPPAKGRAAPPLASQSA